MYLLDTDFIINYFRNKRENIKLFTKIINEPGSRIFITTLTFYELMKGCYKSGNFEKNYKLVSELRKNVETLDFDEDAAKIAGRIFSQLEKKGRIINEADILIAGTCIKNQCSLLTNNIKHFIKIKDLKIIK